MFILTLIFFFGHGFQALGISSKKIVFSEEHHDEEHQAEEQNTQPTAKIGAKKQRKLEEKQARKAQREVTRHRHNLMSLFFIFWLFFPFANCILRH